MPILQKVLRVGEGKTLKEFQGIATAVNDIEPHFESFSEE